MKKEARIIRALRRGLRINTNTEVLRIYAYRIFPTLIAMPLVHVHPVDDSAMIDLRAGQGDDYRSVEQVRVLNSI